MKTNNNNSASISEPGKFFRVEAIEPPLTKREIYAAMAMNGLCHDYGRNSCVETGAHENIAMISVRIADALIQKLNEGKENE